MSDAKKIALAIGGLILLVAIGFVVRDQMNTKPAAPPKTGNPAPASASPVDVTGIFTDVEDIAKTVQDKS